MEIKGTNIFHYVMNLKMSLKISFNRLIWDCSILIKCSNDLKEVWLKNSD